MRKLLKDWVNKRSMNGRRGGYIIYLWVLIYAMLMIPLMAQQMEEIISVREHIAAYEKSINVRGYGNGLLQVVLGLKARIGQGYFEFGNFAGEVVDDFTKNFSVDYLYSGASIIPVPTTQSFAPAGLNDQFDLKNTKNVSLGSPDDSNYGEPLAYGKGFCNDDMSKRTYDCDTIEIKNKYGGVNSNPNYYYTVPALGTGSAGEKCTAFKLNLNEVYPSGESIDPLDHPCNWNTLQLGASVKIPLYVRVPGDDGDKIVINKPDTLTLRIRFKCKQTNKKICDPKDRFVIWEDGIETDSSKHDSSSRIIQWVIESGPNTFTPNVQWPSPEEDKEDVRPKDNYEITVNRLRLEDPLVTAFKFDPESTISSVRLLGHLVADMHSAFTETPDVSELSSYFSSYIDSGTAPGTERGVASGFLSSVGQWVYNSRYVGKESEEFYGPVFFFQFIDNMYTAENKMYDNVSSNVRLYTLEYQIVSNVPLSNYKYVVHGNANTPDGKHALSDWDKTIPWSPFLGPGVVFSN